MPDENSEKPQSAADKLNFVGMDEVPSLYADSFIVASTGEMFMLYFFRNTPPPFKGADLGTSRTRDATQAQCFARIVVSPNGFSKLLTAMAENAGLVISKPEESQQ